MADTKTDGCRDVKQKSYESELWSLDGVSFHLPLKVIWPEQRDVAYVQPDPIIRHIAIMIHAANDVLNPLSLREDPEGWWINSRDLHKVAHKISHSDPERVLMWMNPRRSPPEDPALYNLKHDDVKLREEFYQRMMSRVYAPWIQSTADLDVLWRMFCGAILEWLVNVQKPVDLMFCKLLPSPWRNGWYHSQRKNHQFTGVMGPGRQAYSKSSKVPFWFLEVQYKKSWWRQTIQAEKIRRKEYGKRRYFRYWLRTLERLRQQTMDQFRSFKKQASMSRTHPDINHVLGRVSPRRPGEQRRIIRDRKDGGIHIVWTKTQKPPKPRKVETKAEQLPLLPNLRKFDWDVRNHRKLHPEPKRNGNHPQGVLLRDVVGVKTPGQELLGVGNQP